MLSVIYVVKIIYIDKSFLFFILLKYRDNIIESCLDFLPCFCTCQHNLSTYEDKKHDFWIIHSIYEARKYFRLVACEVMMHFCENLKSDWKCNWAWCYYILDFELFKFHVKTDAFYYFSIFHSCCLWLLLWLRACAHDFSTLED